MFNLAEFEQITFEGDVTVQLGDGPAQSFKARWRLLSREQLAELGSELRIQEAALVGLSGVLDGARQPIPYSEELKARMLGLFPIQTALVRAFWEEQTRAGRKN